MNKKIFTVGSLILGVVFLLSACGHYRGPHCFTARFVERQIRHLENDLKLSDAQKVQFKEIRERMRKDLIADLEEKQEFMKSVETRIKGDNPNVNEIVASFKTHMKKGEARMETKLDYFTDFYSILNAEQKQILLQKARQHLAKKGEHMDDFLNDLKAMKSE